ncbi:hypothetical protein HYS91_00295 [Candidatus Daviesbacteria bacterium]|nr:hypothetical protein [Candidatus Daviesbacteria bacterium]
MLVHPSKNKQHALELRSKGKSYREINSILGVSKSTLSYWLNNVEVTYKQKEYLLQKQREGRIKGAQKRRDLRIAKEQMILVKASKEVSRISKRELWLLGTIAYWCEGSKQKANNVSGRVIFANSDPFLIKLFVRWIKEICKVPEDRLVYTLYIHETGNLKASLNYWSKILEINKYRFARAILKKHKVSTNRKYNNSLYFGLLRVTVRNSTDLNRQIRGWIGGVNNLLK